MVLVMGISIILHAHAQVVADVFDPGDKVGGVAVYSDTDRLYACRLWDEFPANDYEI
jgi:hypothetical protein